MGRPTLGSRCLFYAGRNDPLYTADSDLPFPGFVVYVEQVQTPGEGDPDVICNVVFFDRYGHKHVRGAIAARGVQWMDRTESYITPRPKGE